MAKLVPLILITFSVTLLNTTSIMDTKAEKTITHNNMTCTFSVPRCVDDELEWKDSKEVAGENFKYSVINQVNSTNLKDFIDIASSFHTRHTKSTYIEDVGYWLKNKLQSVCDGKVYFHNFSQIDKDSSYNLSNIVCDIGSSTSVYDNSNHILISAHYDSRMEDINQTNARAPGADDNASGIAAVLELARILSQVNSKNNLEFVLFSGEEQGQWGSTAYVRHLQANHTTPDLVINLDMIGNDILGRNKAVIEYDEGNKIRTNDIYSKKVADYIKQMASEYTNLEISLRTLGKTDLIPFEAAGNTVIGFHDGGSKDNPNYHSISDTLATLDIEYLTSVTQLALATILGLDFS